jgi:hypothetical protein
MSRRRVVYLKTRLTTEENRRLTDVARQWGYKTSAEFIRASLGCHGRLAENIDGLERRQATTMAAMRTEIARLQRTEYVLFAMLENLAKTILTHLPPLAAENRASAIALGKAAYERYLKAVGMSLNNGSKVALQDLAALDD